MPLCWPGSVLSSLAGLLCSDRGWERYGGPGGAQASPSERLQPYLDGGDILADPTALVMLPLEDAGAQEAEAMRGMMCRTS